MTRDEALAECRRLAAEHPDRTAHSWLPRELAPGEWTVAKVRRSGPAAARDRPGGQAAPAAGRRPAPGDVARRRRPVRRRLAWIRAPQPEQREDEEGSAQR